ncbi:GtrA family protein [Devosia beringensis]|uniref:GtrA family protein n=1 Tax=Devosia beringensis TaxID=2657486 RepID=UPI00186B5D05|nr:GtrA family protein [Devosia beringensis]
MSAALHSLMFEAPRPTRERAPGAGVLPFIGVGAGGAAAFVVLSSLLVWLHTGYADWVVNTASYAVLILPVYLLHHRFSFASAADHGQALPRYLAVQGMALLLAAGFSYGVHEIVALPTVLASIAVVVLTASVNYAVLRFWAFAHRPAVATLAM